MPVSFTDIEYSNRKKITKREVFLNMMDAIVPWDEWCAVIEPYYASGKIDRPAIGLERMLRMYLLQTWFNLSDPAAEDEIYDSYAMRKFVKIDFMTDSMPDETTMYWFRHLLEDNGLSEQFFALLTKELEDNGLMWKGGTIVDAVIIASTNSTKNAGKERDAEMPQTKKAASGTTE